MRLGTAAQDFNYFKAGWS